MKPVMRNVRCSIALLVSGWLGVAAGLPNGPAAGEAGDPAQRVWTSLSGHTIRADFVELSQGVARFQDAEGQVRIVQLALLVPADQARVRNLQARKEAAETPRFRRTSERWLPVFEFGPGKGSHAVYSNAAYVARVGASARVEIQCLDKGRPVGKPISLGASYSYEDPQTRRGAGRSIVAFENPPDPTLEPGLLVFEGLLKDGVRFGRGIAFLDRSVEAWGWVQDPKGIESPTAYSLSLGFSASHAFEADVTQEERAATLAPFGLVLRPVSKQPVRYPYAGAVDGYVSPVVRADLEGPLFGRHKVSVSAGQPREGALRVYGYPGFSPYQGFSIILQKKDPASRSRRCSLVLVIE